MLLCHHNYHVPSKVAIIKEEKDSNRQNRYRKIKRERAKKRERERFKCHRDRDRITKVHTY
jgi:hypothetical protein